MYGQGQGGFGAGGWTPWSGMNTNPQAQQQQKQQQHRPVGINQGNNTSVQGQLQQNMAGMAMSYGQQYGGIGVQTNPNMMGMMNYGGANMMGRIGNPATGAMTGAANIYGTAAANPNIMGLGNAYGANNSYGQQQQVLNPYMQQQQQHHQQNMLHQHHQQNQSIYQTQIGYPRPQPPLPPGPPPPQKEQAPSTNSNPPLPMSFNSSVDKPPPPPPTNNSSSDFIKPGTNKDQPKQGNSFRNQNEPKIPDQLLQFFKTAESARQMEQATEALANINPLMALNVSQDLFGIKTDSIKQGIPGLDFLDSNVPYEDNSENRNNVKPSSEPKLQSDERVMRVDFNSMKDRKGQESSTSSFLNRKEDLEKLDSNQALRNQSYRSNSSRNNDNQKSSGFVWELRPEIQQEINIVGKSEKSGPVGLIGSENQQNKPRIDSPIKNIDSNPKPNIPLVEVKTKLSQPGETRPPLSTEQKISSGDSLQEKKPVSSTIGSLTASMAIIDSKSLNTSPLSSCKDSISCDKSESASTLSGSSTSVSAKILLESSDGKPVEYDKKTLKAFDKKFREWEKQFENWKMGNQNHPDRDAYNKYMDQWNLWREQLIEQRRFIIDSMNKARLEGAELAMQKSLEFSSFETSKDTLMNFQDDSRELQERNKPLFDGLAQKGPGKVPPPVPLISNKPALDRKNPDPNKRTDEYTTPSENLLQNPNFRGGEIKKTVPPPPPLMSLPAHNNQRNDSFSSSSISQPFNTKEGFQSPISHSHPDQQNKSFGFGNQRNEMAQSFQKDNSRNDRPVERILRDKDRPLLPIKSQSDLKNSLGFEKRSTVPPNISERVARDPEEARKGQSHRNPFSQDQETNPWDITSKSDVNPFEAAQRQQQNPYAQNSNQNLFGGWGKTSEEDNLPKLSDFLKKDDSICSQTSRSGMGRLQNQNANNSGFMTLASNSKFSDSNMLGVRRDPELRNQGPITGAQGLTFEPTSKGMPLVQATPKPHETNVFQKEEKYEGPDMSQWFTRDRARAFEEEYSNYQEEESHTDTNIDYEWEPDAPAVIDYGHGSNPTDEHDEYDRRYRDETDEQEEESGNVTIDYGHGSKPQSYGDPPSGNKYHADDDYYDKGEDPYNDPYEGGRGYYNDHSTSTRQIRGHGGGGGGMMLRGRGRLGRGISGGPVPNQFIRPMGPGPRYGNPAFASSSLPMRQRGGILPIPPELQDVNKPMPNRGSGRGGPIRLPVYEEEINPLPISSGYLDRPINRSNTQEDSDLGTERVDSPEVVIISSPTRVSRRAPPRGREEIDDRRRENRIPRDGGRNNRGSNRNRDDSFSRGRNDSYKEDDQYRSAFQEESWEPEDEQKKVERYPKNREDDRQRDRGERREDNISHSSRRDRERDRNTRDRFGGRSRRHSRSRSRSRTKSPFDRVSIFRNPNPLGSSQGSNNMELQGGVNPPPPRYQTVMIEDILNKPGRMKRPSNLVVILRGLPGSGKTHVAKLIKDREVEMGGSAPRILSLDDYFMAETEKVVKDPVTGAEVKETFMQYEYEEDLETKYRSDLVKTFKKNVENGYFQFIIVDCVNNLVKHFEEMVTHATQRRFQVYIAEVEESVETCVKRNVHQRTRDQIQKISKTWERTPATFVKLDIRPLLQDEAVQDVEMEDVSDTDNNLEEETAEKRNVTTPSTEAWEDEETESKFPAKSKWETIDHSEEKLNRLDGLNVRKKNPKEDDSNFGTSVESWLQSHVPEDYVSRQKTRPGQKRVRWADIEEKQAQERMRDVGFVVGQTDWNRMTDPTFGSSALTKTKYI